MVESGKTRLGLYVLIGICPLYTASLSTELFTLSCTSSRLLSAMYDANVRKVSRLGRGLAGIPI